ncbi:MAG: alkaline phosphatase [Kordiimonadaceae bacterium]|nr:alkaline phosphatase [Kordiimonadaceae bacterium]
MAALLTGCAGVPKEPISSAVPHSTVGTTDSWLAQGDATVKNLAAQRQNKRRAKNVILFVGDGMGISTLTAGRIYEGQLRGETGEENLLSFENFPYSALVKTYNVNAQVSDSAGTATALNTGTKTRIGVINTAPTHPSYICKGMEKDAPVPLAYYAEKIGMSTGVVSTAGLTHATPAAVYAHSPGRTWEADVHLTEEAKANGCTDIASQIVSDMDGNGLEVALGGGLSHFLPIGEASGIRADGKNIAKEWTDGRPTAKFVQSSAELAAVDHGSTDHLLGLFSDNHMQFNAIRPKEQPSLSEMTEAAIKVLSKNKKGYYLMVEAGRIDHGHHAGSAFAALTETAALSAAVKKALSMVDTKDTLILVTADHSHTLTISGYPKRGNPILGLSSAHDIPENEYSLAEDGKPYTTLGYQNGPGAIAGERKTLTQEEVLSPRFQQQAAYPLKSETHGGEDVALFAVGPWAHLARGTIEQNVIFHIMDHALGLRKRAAKK